MNADNPLETQQRIIEGAMYRVYRTSAKLSRRLPRLEHHNNKLLFQDLGSILRRIKYLLDLNFI